MVDYVLDYFFAGHSDFLESLPRKGLAHNPPPVKLLKRVRTAAPRPRPTSARLPEQENADFPLHSQSPSCYSNPLTDPISQGAGYSYCSAQINSHRQTHKQAHTEFKTHPVWPKEFISQTHYCELSVLSFRFQLKVCFLKTIEITTCK